MNEKSGFKIGKLYVCRNPLPTEHDEWFWYLFAGAKYYKNLPNKLHENDVFIVLDVCVNLEICNDPITVIKEYWIKVLTEDGIIGWFNYCQGEFTEESIVQEF